MNQPFQRLEKAPTSNEHRIDSIPSNLRFKIDRLTNLPQKLTPFADILKPDLTRYNRKLDSIKGTLTRRIDSLSRLNLPTGQYPHLLDSIERAGPLKDIKQAETKLRSLQNKINASSNKLNAGINKIESKIDEKLGLINKEGGPGTNLPGNLNLPAGAIGIPSGQGSLPDVQVPGVNLAAPSTNLNLPPGSLPVSNNPLGQINGLENNLPGEIKDIGKAQNEIKNITGAPQEQLGKLKDAGGLGQVSKELGQVSQIAQEAKGYKKDLKHLSKGNLDSVSQLKTLEKRAMEVADKKELQGQLKQADQYKSMIAKGNDPKAMEKLAKEQVQEQAVNHFAGKEKELQGAMSQISKYKQKYSSLNSIHDIPKRARNTMHGKPLIERIVPALNMQFQKKSSVLIDFNPQIGYRFNGRLTAGAGWNERVGLHHYTHLTLSDRIYGPRTFAEFKFRKGFALRGEVEVMNTFVPPLITGPTAADPRSRQWVLGIFGGLKKEYKLSKYIRGNIQTMYNFHCRFYKTSPYGDRLNVRIGFEFPMKKKVRH